MSLARILYISPGPNFNPRSPSYQLPYKLLSQTYRGYIITTGPKAEQFEIDNFTYISMKSNFTISSNLRFLSFCIYNAFKLARAGEKVDLVTTYDPLKTGFIGLLASWLHRAKFIPEVNGVYTSPYEWIDLPNSLCTRAKRTLYRTIMTFVLKHADGIKLLYADQVSPFTPWTRNKVVKHFPCFVATEGFEDLREDPEVLFAGFPFKRKGVDILIDAFKSIAPKYPEWKLKILGWFPDTTELYAAIAGHPQIFHHLPVHYSEMPKHIGSCAILVLPSRSEAMGRVLVEAMAAGKPTVGSNVDGIPCVINNGVDGLLFESGNRTDLANKLDMLMGNRELRIELGHAGRRKAKEHFSEELYRMRIVNFYREILSIHRS